jgi:hypothetical protein
MSSGCGTMANVMGQEVWLIGPPPERHIDVFGGVDNDVRWMSRGIDAWASWAILAAAIDMPFSFVADIITLPWTACQSLIAVGPGQTLEQRRRGPEIQ